MEATTPPGEPVNVKKLSDQELANLFLSGPTNDECREEFAARCVRTMRIMINGLVFVKRMRPPSQDPNAFAKDSFSLAQEKFWKGIRGLRSPQALNGWLKQVARTAVLQEIEKITGEGPIPRIYESLDGQEETASEKYLKRAHELEERGSTDEGYSSFGSKYWQDPALLAVDRELREIVIAALRIHAQGSRRDADCALWMEIKLLEDPPVEEIAKKRGTTKDDVWHLFRHDQENLLHILTDSFHITLQDFP